MREKKHTVHGAINREFPVYRGTVPEKRTAPVTHPPPAPQMGVHPRGREAAARGMKKSSIS